LTRNSSCHDWICVFCGPERPSPGRIRNFLHPELCFVWDESLRRPGQQRYLELPGSNDGVEPLRPADWDRTVGSGATGDGASGCTLSGGVLTCLPGTGPFQPDRFLTPVAGRNPQCPNTASSTGLAPCDISQYILLQSNFSATGYTVSKVWYVQQWNFGIQRELPLASLLTWLTLVHMAYICRRLTPTSTRSRTGSSLRPASQYDESCVVTSANPVGCPAFGNNANHAVAIGQVVPASAYPFQLRLGIPLPGALPRNLKFGQLDRPFPQYVG